MSQKTAQRTDIWYPSPDVLDYERDLAKKFILGGLARTISLHATGGISGETIVSSALRHEGHHDFLITDLRHAYQSVVRRRLFGRLKSHDEELGRRAQGFAATSWPKQPGLPLGSALSPLFFNVYARPLDDRLAEISEELGDDTVYTRFFDDIVLSRPEGAGGFPPAVRRQVRAAIEDENFIQHDRKTKVQSLGRGSVTITGMTLYPDGRIQPSAGIIKSARKSFVTLLQQPLDLDALAVAAGYNGVLQTPGMPGSETVAGLRGLFEQANGRRKQRVDEAKRRAT